jgi:tetratricopeptide (TPR) repeat protein
MAEVQTQETARLPLPVAGGFFLLSFLTYLHTMNPSVSVGDSGEFIAAAWTLGLPHAPSYPLYCLLSKAALALNPFASPAYGVNLFSVFCAAGAVTVFLSIAVRLGLSFGSAFASAFLLLFSNVLWDQAVAAEVFGLNALMALALAWIWTLPQIPLLRRSALFGLILGLGVGNHQTLVLVLPAFGVLFVRECRSQRLSVQEAFRVLSAAFVFFIAGFSVYAYLPVRSFRNPDLDWSNPETLRNFWRVVTRADYGSLSLSLGEQLPRNFDSAWGQGRRYFSCLLEDWGGAGLAAGAVGAFFWFLKDFWTAGAYAVWFLCSGLGFLILGNLPFDAQSSGILPRFFLLSAVPLALAAAHAFEMLNRFRRGAAWLALILPLFILVRGHGYRTFSRTDFAADDFGRNLLRTLPGGAVLFMDGGDDTFYTSAYLTLAEGRRRDLELHDRGGLIFPNPYGKDFRLISKTEKQDRRRQIEGAFLGIRPLYYATFDRKVLPGSVLEPRGLLYEARTPSKTVPAGTDPLWEIYSFRGVYEYRPDRPYRLRALIPVYPYLRGMPELDSFYLKRAAGFGMDIPWLRGNLGWELAIRGYDLTQSGRVAEAEAVYRLAAELDPKAADAATNLGVLSEKSNRLQEAEKWYRRAIEADPKYAEAYYNLGVLFWRQGRWTEVVAMFEKTLALRPDHPQAERYLRMARMRSLQGKIK